MLLSLSDNHAFVNLIGVAFLLSIVSVEVVFKHSHLKLFAVVTMLKGDFSAVVSREEIFEGDEKDTIVSISPS